MDSITNNKVQFLLFFHPKSYKEILYLLKKYLGIIKEGATKDCEFTVTNTGNRPLVIKGTTTSCDCTTVETDKQEIPAGGYCVLTTHYKAEAKGDFLRTITFFCNAENTPVEFTITGTVE